jgi:hypothetical protein
VTTVPWRNPYDATTKPLESWLAETAHEVYTGLGNWPTPSELQNCGRASLGFTPSLPRCAAVLDALRGPAKA